MPINKVDGKRDGKQKYRVRVNYTDDHGKHQRIERTVYGLEEAKAVEVALNHKINIKETVLKKMTVQQLYDEYSRYKKTDVRESTAAKTNTIYRTHLQEYFGSIPLDKLKIPIFQDWKIEMDNKGVALATKKNAYSELRALLYYAVRMNYISSNPLTKVGNFKGHSEIKKDIQYYTTDEFLKFIIPAKKLAASGTIQDYGFYLFFMFAYFTGARKGEINALRWCDIKDDIMYITRSVAQKIKGGDRFTPPKNKSSVRNIQLPNPLINAINEYKVKCEKLEGFNDECLICGFDRPLRDTTIQIRNNMYSTQAGVKTIRIHDFRHSHASLLANNGINIQEIARRLGHAKIEITLNTYSHLYPQEQERALDVLNKIEFT